MRGERGGEGRPRKSLVKKVVSETRTEKWGREGKGGISQGKSGRERPTTEKREEELKEEIAGDATAVHLQTYTATLALFPLAPEATRGGRRRFESPPSFPPSSAQSFKAPSFLPLPLLSSFFNFLTPLILFEIRCMGREEERETEKVMQ